MKMNTIEPMTIEHPEYNYIPILIFIFIFLPNRCAVSQKREKLKVWTEFGISLNQIKLHRP